MLILGVFFVGGLGEVCMSDFENKKKGRGPKPPPQFLNALLLFIYHPLELF